MSSIKKISAITLYLVIIIILILICCRLLLLSKSNDTDNINDDIIRNETLRKRSPSDLVTIHMSASAKICGRLIDEQNVTIAQFLGIRYAQKPKLFRRSRPLNYDDSNALKIKVIDALRWPPFCMQNNLQQFDYLTRIYNRNITDDCLYLNIWTPFDAIDDTNNLDDRSLLPVIIYIHGGSFNYMGISMEAYNGATISAIGKVIFVTINYRVGIFGFFENNLDDQSDNLIDKNVGLWDQITAIEWIRQHIHYFGGDRNQITLHGQSAGAISIGLLMMSPASRHLFARAIMQSASPMMLKDLYQNNHFQSVIQLANCSSNIDDIDNDIKSNDDNGKNLESEAETNDTSDDYYDGEDDEDDYEPIDSKIEADLRATELRIARQQILNETRCLMALTADQLNEIQQKILRENVISFSPSIPSELLPHYFSDIRSTEIVQQEVLLGANLNESTLYLHHELPELIELNEKFEVNLTILNKILDKLDQPDQDQYHYHHNHHQDQQGHHHHHRHHNHHHQQHHHHNPMKQLSKVIIRRIQNADTSIGLNEFEIVQEFLVFLSDFLFKGPVYKFSKFLAEDPRKNIYLYLFQEENRRKYPRWIGSPHWNEMDYVFGLPLKYPQNFTQDQQTLSLRMIKLWTNFVKYGHPTIDDDGDDRFSAVPDWPKFNSNNNWSHLNLLSTNLTIDNNFRMKFFDIFDLLYENSS